MSNTSATGGYLVETPPLPLHGQALLRFFHGVFVGVSALDPSLVRPSWQANPPPTPDIATNWLAFGVQAVRPDNSPYVEQQEDLSAIMIRHEEVDIACIFYGPDAEGVASTLRDGLFLSQNRDALQAGGFGLIGVGDTIHLPELVNDRYYNRADMTLNLRRELRRDYPILPLLGTSGTIVGNRAASTLTRDWSIE